MSVLSTLEGDAPCAECGTHENLIWFTDSVFWNAVVREAPQSPWNGADAILCIPCFVWLVEKVGYAPDGWRLTPEWHWETLAERQQRKPQGDDTDASSEPGGQS